MDENVEEDEEEEEEEEDEDEEEGDDQSNPEEGTEAQCGDDDTPVLKNEASPKPQQRGKYLFQICVITSSILDGCKMSSVKVFPYAHRPLCCSVVSVQLLFDYRFPVRVRSRKGRGR